MRQFTLSILLLLFFTDAYSQLSINNIAEYQHGNIPDTEPENMNTLYNQFNIHYKWKPLKASLRVEQFYSPDSLSGDYQKLSQFQLQYRKRGLDFKIGNFYETLGQGLLLRAYELKNAVYEDPISRVKQGFYKDILGAYGSYSSKYFAFKALSGKMLDNQLAITSDKRRENYINAGELRGTYQSYSVGGIVLNSTFADDTKNYLSVYTNGSIGASLNFYGEYASQMVDSLLFFNTSKNSSYGAYFNISYSKAGYGISIEVKDYHNFFLGSGYSDPPTLVKEHSYKLLNRITHVTDLLDERGIQIEFFWSPFDNHLLTFNHSRNINEHFAVYRSFEYFMEYHISIASKNQIKIFADYSGDESKAEPETYTEGLYYTRYLNKSWSIAVESEFQQIKRQYTGLEVEYASNIYGGIAINKSTKLSASFVLEFTNDPQAADRFTTENIEKKRFYPGLNLFYRPNKHHALQMFAGERRGGPACTAGICYEVLDFKGIELRWTYKL